MESKGLPRYWCYCRRRLDCSQLFPSLLHSLDGFLKTLGSKNTSIPGSCFPSQLDLELRFDLAIRPERFVPPVAL